MTFDRFTIALVGLLYITQSHFLYSTGKRKCNLTVSSKIMLVKPMLFAGNVKCTLKAFLIK